MSNTARKLDENHFSFLPVNPTSHRHVRIQKYCPLCASDNTIPVMSERTKLPEDHAPELKHFNRVWSHLLECKDCTFAFTEEIPVSPTFFKNRYDNRHFDPEYEVKSNRKHFILNEIFSMLKKNGHSNGELLDVGSFAGKLLKYSHDNGFTPTGIEVNPKLAQYSKEILGFDVICGEVQSTQLPKEKFDVITIIDVLEHLVEPKIVLQNLIYALKPGGVIVIKVPHYNMQKFKQKVANALGINSAGIFGGYGHINHFNTHSMIRVLKELGLELHDCYNARSEHWENEGFIKKFKNKFRDFYWRFSNTFMKTLGLNIGMNTMYLAKKPSNKSEHLQKATSGQ